MIHRERRLPLPDSLAAPAAVGRLAAALTLVLAAHVAPATPVVPAAAAQATQEAEPNDYSDEASWLCRPGRDDLCAGGMDATVVHADGTLSRESWEPDPDAPIDCFYAYPTVSTDQAPQADMDADEAERRVVRQQFARFASVCRPYAPLYRQVSLAGLMAGRSDEDFDLTRGIQYDDVRDAFRHYLEHDNQGRPFVLVGHSQGSYILTALLAREIEGTPAHDRLLSALLTGATVAVPEGEDVGGALRATPLCRSEGQTGCLVAYSAFRATAPPPENTLFGRVEEPGMTAACTNPANLDGGSAELHAYLSAEGTTIVGARPAEPWVEGGPAVETPFVSVPGLLTAECTTNEHATYLEVTVHGDPSDPRVDDIGGDLTPQWGLHLVDVNLAQGDLISIVEAQSRAVAR